jgi:hypothetical protein
MRFTLRLLALLLLFGGLSTAHAQTRVGVGVALSSSGLDNSAEVVEQFLSPASVFVPITFGSFRVEPEIGLFTLSAEEDRDSDSVTTVQLAVGLFGTTQRDATLFYYGGRIGATFVNSSFEFGNFDASSSQTNLLLAPAAGAEYFFSPHFSLGAEAQLSLLSFGDQETESDGDDETLEIDQTILRTRGLFFARFHF